MNTRLSVLVAALLVTLACASLFFSGCDERDYVGRHPDHLLVFVAVTGDSMQPTFPGSAIVPMVLNYPYEELKVGDTVIFWDYKRNGFTHHRLHQKQGPYFIAKGDNPETNARVDAPFVTRDNYIGKTLPEWRKVIVAP